MTLTEGCWRLPNWAIGNVLVVPQDGPWAYLHFPGMDEPIAMPIYECEIHTNWEPCDRAALTLPEATS